MTVKLCWCGCPEGQHLAQAIEIEARLQGKTLAELLEGKKRKSKKKEPVQL